LIDRVRDEWVALCNEGPFCQPFGCPEWTTAYLMCFRPSGKFRLVTAHSENRLVAVLPLLDSQTWFRGLPARKLRGAGNYHTARYGMLRMSGRVGDEAAEAIWRDLQKRADWDVIEFPDAPGEGTLESIARQARTEGHPAGKWESMRSLYIPLEGRAGEGEPGMQFASHAFRLKLRRRMRKLEELGSVRLRRVEHYDPEVLEAFYKLEDSGWKGREHTSILQDEKVLDFYSRITRAAAQRGYLSLYFLELDGRPIAGHLGFTFRGRYFLPKAAYHEEFRKLGPGHLLVQAVLKDCAQRGVTEFDFVGPAMPDESEWTDAARTYNYWYIFRRDWYGRLLHALKFAMRRSPQGPDSPELES
jgi:CelD/BcsL family acetyltransferase involved in cellulose biosynthesis